MVPRDGPVCLVVPVSGHRYRAGMRVLVAPDSFTGSMTAAQAARAIATGWQRVSPADVLTLRPVSDGGPGFIATLAAAGLGTCRPVSSTGPAGQPRVGELLVGDDTTYIESAQFVGGTDSSDPVGATSAGLGRVLAEALATGSRRIVIGLGGSLITDGGAGMLAALGATATDAAGTDVTDALFNGAADLMRVTSVDLAPARQLLADRELIIATDVTNPLLGARGAARGFAPQKGANESQVEFLERALTNLAHACGRTSQGKSPAVALGSGAAGGLGFALLHLGARAVSGIEWVLAAIDFAATAAECDLVITGEGSFDWQSLQGKVISGVCAVAMSHGLPVLVLAGQLDVGRREWMALGVSDARGIVEPENPAAPSLPAAMSRGPELLAQLAAQSARTWSR